MCKVVIGFKDVLVWLNLLELFFYLNLVNVDLVVKGEVFFEKICSNCYGIYGEEEIYLNKLVLLDEVKIDFLYVIYVYILGIVEWYNNSWFV